MGASATKRERQKAAKAEKGKQNKRKNTMDNTKTVLFLLVPVVLIIVVSAWIIIDSVIARKPVAAPQETTAAAADSGAEETKPSEEKIDYSEYLTDEGLIKDIAVDDYVSLPDLSTLSVDKKDLIPSDEEMETALKAFNERVLVKDADKIIAKGDVVNIDYVGSIDGVEFEGGNTKGNGADLTIGSKQYIDDFEDQLIGHAPGEEVTVEVTFPENYGKENLNGKDAVFAVTINGVYVDGEPSQEYIDEKFKDYGSNYDEIKEYTYNRLYNSKLEEAAWNAFIEKCEFNEYPEGYAGSLEESNEYLYRSEYEYYNSYYYSMTGSYQWETIYDYYDMDKDALDKLIKEDANEQCEYYLAAQSVYEKNALKVTEDDVKACLTRRGYSSDNLDDLIEAYGKGYVYQSALSDAARKYIAENIKINE